MELTIYASSIKPDQELTHIEFSQRSTDNICISLEENPSTGWRWHYIEPADQDGKPHDAKKIIPFELIRTEFVPNISDASSRENLVGSGGYHRFFFENLEGTSGRVDFLFELKPAFGDKKAKDAPDTSANASLTEIFGKKLMVTVQVYTHHEDE